MATFTVCTDDLLSLASELSSLVSELGQAGDIAPNCDAGNPRVESKLQSFFSDWSDGMDKIERNISGLNERISNAAEGYDGTDGAIAGALS